MTCETEGAHLAMIKSKETQDYLKTKYGSPRMWMGLSDLHQEGKFKFVDGSKLSTNFWAPGEPNDYLNNEDCAMTNSKSPGAWNDGLCSKKFQFLCQKPLNCI